MTTLVPVDKVHDEHGDFRSRDDDKAGWTFDSFFSDCEVTLMMNWATRWRKNGGQGQLGEDGGSFVTADFWYF
ncbi:MAG: hypothetical protein V2A69_09830 [Pseudomonadota bacterium]